MAKLLWSVFVVSVCVVLFICLPKMLKKTDKLSFWSPSGLQSEQPNYYYNLFFFSFSIKVERNLKTLLHLKHKRSSNLILENMVDLIQKS